MRRSIIGCVVAALLAGCQDEQARAGEVPAGAEWLLDGTQDERFARVARHLRGFDMAMVETGYRYSELYWASRDRNWGYASYQLGKIETAVANGLERRPARASSARILDGSIRSVRQAIEAEDAPAMDTALEQLTTTCNACHQAERVPIIRIAPPTARLSSVAPDARSPTGPGAPLMKISLDRLLALSAPASTILVRLMVGGVFLSEGIQKFLEPASLGAGRFERIGLPAAEFLGSFVGATEILCGTLVLFGLLTRLASVPLIATMLVAIVTTKVPIFLGSGFWGLQLRELSSYGFWSMAHEARTDFAMLLGSVFLLIVGAGPFAVDAALQRRRQP